MMSRKLAIFLVVSETFVRRWSWGARRWHRRGNRIYVPSGPFHRWTKVVWLEGEGRCQADGESRSKHDLCLYGCYPDVDVDPDVGAVALSSQNQRSLLSCVRCCTLRVSLTCFARHPGIYSASEYYENQTRSGQSPCCR